MPKETFFSSNFEKFSNPREKINSIQRKIGIL
jgi:hypothetical protein